MTSGIPLFPFGASTMASRVDALYLFLIAVTVFFSLLIAGLIVALAPAPRAALAAQAPVTMQQVRAVVEQRCVMCHNAQVSNKNVQLHTDALIRQHQQQILQRAVIARTMPLNNATGITEAERDLLRRWADPAARAPSPPSAAAPSGS